MNRGRIMLLMAALVLAGDLAAVTPAEAIATVRQQLAAEQQALAADRARVSTERAALRQQLAQAEAAAAQAATQLATLARETAEAAAKAATEQRRGSDLARERDRWREAVRFNAREMSTLYALARPGATDLTAGVLDAPADVTLATQLERLDACYDRYLAAAGALTLGPAELFDAAGKPLTATVLQLGLLGGNYQAGRELGLLYRAGEKGALQRQSSGLPRRQRMLLPVSFAPATSVRPVLLDLGQGLGVGRLQQELTWGAWFAAGGLCMYPLLLVAVFSLLMVAERCWYYALTGMRGGRLNRALPPLLREGKLAEAEAALAGTSGPMRNVWEKGIQLLRHGSTSMEEALHECILGELPALERSLGALAVCAALAPLLGLLGTVTGMIRTFDLITLYGSGNPRMLAGGIAEALITTEAGLSIAIPAVLAHAVLSRRAKLIAAQMDQAAMFLLDTASRTDRAPGGPP